MGTAFERVTEALTDYGSTCRGYMWNCPGAAHGRGDQNRSLSVLNAADRVLLNCHMGCTAEEVAGELRMTLSDLFDEPLEMVSHEVARYNYVNGDGEILFAKVRYEPKSFSLVHLNGSGWVNGLGEARRVLYNLPRVKEAVAHKETLYVCEGEKDADRLTGLGYAATCNFDGANKAGGKPKWRPEYSDMIAGATDVVVIADRDEPGVAHASAIKESLAGRVGRCRVLQAAVDLHGADVSDHLDYGFTVEQLVPLKSTRYTKVDWRQAWKETPEEVDWLWEPIVEAGTVNALFGKPGVGKSLVTLEIALHVIRAGRPVVYVDDENRRADTVSRLKAFGASPDELDMLAVYSFCGIPALDSPAGGADLLDLAEENDAALVILDTTSRLVAGKENDADTYLQFYRNSLVPLKGKGIAVLRLDHPGKDESKGQRGSSAKEGDVDTIWWLSRETDTHFTMECQKNRGGRVQPGHMVFLDRQFNPLRHEFNAYPNLPADRTDGIVRTLDRLDIPLSLGRPKIREILNEHSISAPNEILAAAIAYRKQRSPHQAVPEPVQPQVSEPGQSGQSIQWGNEDSEDQWWEK